jgi:hypothetical protein
VDHGCGVDDRPDPVALRRLSFLPGVAETLRIPIGTVKSRLARARLQMKNLLQTNSNYAMVTTMPNTLSATCA